MYAPYTKTQLLFCCQQQLGNNLKGQPVHKIKKLLHPTCGQDDIDAVLPRGPLHQRGLNPPLLVGDAFSTRYRPALVGDELGLGNVEVISR